MAALTGESRPVPRLVAAPADVPALERPDLVFMGTSVVTGRAKAVVLATGLQTEFGRVYRLTAGTESRLSPLQRQVAKMARRVAGVALSMGALLFLVRLAGGSPLVAAFFFALGVMVALVPEGLPATLSVSLAIGVRQMARRHALVKRLLAVEALGSTTVICTDKTGTLTTAEMTVQSVWESGRRHAVTGVGYEPAGAVEDPEPATDVLRSGLLCSNARLLAPDAGPPGLARARRHHRGRHPGGRAQGGARPRGGVSGPAPPRRVPVRPRAQAHDPAHRPRR